MRKTNSQLIPITPFLIAIGVGKWQANFFDSGRAFFLTPIFCIPNYELRIVNYFLRVFAS